MLESKFKENDVVTVKLSTGEEIMGYYKESSLTSIVLRKPLVPVPTREGSIGLAPYIMSVEYLNEGDGNISFAMHSVVTVIKTGKKFADYYVKQISGVDLSQQSTSKLIT